MLAIVDYGAGNLTSVRHAFERAGARPTVTEHPRDLARADRIVFPGVGAAASGMAGLAARGLDVALREAIAAGTPVLAICLGMQLLFDHSEEDGGTDGLGVLPGRVVRFDFPSRVDSDSSGSMDGGMGRVASRVKVPHMGWNPVRFPSSATHALLADIPDDSAFYFVHGYHGIPGWDDPVWAEVSASGDTGDGVSSVAGMSGRGLDGGGASAFGGRVWGVSEYGGCWFVAMVGGGNVFGVQGHPERSGEVGGRLLENFLGWDGRP